MHLPILKSRTILFTILLLTLTVLAFSPTAKAQSPQAYGWGVNSDGQLGNETNVWRRTIAFPVSNSAGAVQVSTGVSHTLLLKSDGTVWACGRNSEGQLGDGTTTRHKTPVQVTGLTNVAQVVAGSLVSYALKTDGTLWRWGQIDFINNIKITTPEQVSGISGVIQIAAGSVHLLALRADGTVWGFGANDGGQLGDGTTVYRGSFVQAKGLTFVKEIAVGGAHSFAIKRDGTVWAWGSNSNGQLGDGTSGFGTDKSLPQEITSLKGAKKVAGGQAHSLAIASDGTVWTWGANGYGQLGNGNYGGGVDLNIPTKVVGMADAVQVSGGTFFSLVVKADGTVWGFGENAYAEIGDGTTETFRPSPTQVLGLKDVAQVSAGYQFAISVGKPITPNNTNLSLPKIIVPAVNPYSLTAKLTWKTTGKPIAGESIDFSIDGKTLGSVVTDANGVASYPMQPSTKAGSATYKADYIGNVLYRAISRTATITYTTYDPTLKGNLQGWGWNYFGQVGNGTTIQSYIVSQVLGLSNVVQASPGYYHSLALRADGTVWGMGANDAGQLGDGTTIQRQTPVKALNVTKGVQILANGVTSVLLKADGTVWYWGLGEMKPLQIKGLSDIVQIVSQGTNLHALKSDGTLWKVSDLTQRATRVTGITDVTQISAGAYHLLALKADGTVWAWGANAAGQLGDGTTNGSDTPLQVKKLSRAIQVACGLVHSLALMEDGTVAAWGSNSYGQLGDGTYTDRSSPVSFGGISGVVQLTGSVQNTYALKSDGTIWTCGDPASGQRAGAELPFNKPSQIPYLTGQTTVAALFQTVFSAHAISRDTVLTTADSTAQYAAPTGLAGRLLLKGTTVALPVKTIAFLSGNSLLGKNYTVASGLATLIPPQPIPVGAYLVNVAFQGTPLFNASSAMANLTIIKADMALYLGNLSARYGETASVKVRLKRLSDNSFPAGFKIEFKLDDKSLGTLTTDAQGYVTLNYKVEEALSLGAHTLAALYAGDANHNSISKSITLTVNRANSQLAVVSLSGKTGDTVTLKAILTRATDATPLPNRVVTFSIAGVKVGTGTTDATGLATLSYKITQTKGTYKIKALFSGDTPYYGTSDETANLTVN